MKSDPATRDIPIIALSAHAPAGTREKALAAGCNEFDTKPVDFDRLVANIRRVLNATAWARPSALPSHPILAGPVVPLWSDTPIANRYPARRSATIFPAAEMSAM